MKITVVNLYVLCLVLTLSKANRPDRAVPSTDTTGVSSTTDGTRSTSGVHDDGDDDDDPINWSVERAVKKTKQNLNSLIKGTLPMMMSASSGMSPECTRGLMQFAVGLRQLKDWAARMLDSSSKLPSGVLMGTTLALGSYDECVDIIVTNEKVPQEVKFQGKYCLIDVRVPKSLLRSMDIVAKESGLKNFNTTFMKLFPEKRGFEERFKFAISLCLPSTCSIDDVGLLSKNLIHKLGFSTSVFSCDVKHSPEIKNNQIAVICILVPLIVLVILGTLIDILAPFLLNAKLDSEKSFRKSFVNTFRVFSLYSNTKKFLAEPKNDGKFNMLSGIRFFSVNWIILGHSYYFPDDLHFSKLKDMFTVTETQYDVTFMVVQNTALAVDTFFLVTAFLTTYSSWRRMDRTNGKLSAINFFMKRVMRLLPAQFLVIGVLIILPLFGSGPIWDTTWKIPVENCENYWWLNLVSLQNFWGLEDTCLFHTWFLAVSMQFHILTFFLLFLLYRKPILGVLTNAGLIIAGVVAVALVTLYKGYPPTFDSDPSNLPVFHDFYNNVYTHMYSHFGPYCTGVLLAFFISKNPGKRIQETGCRAVCWIVATAVGLATVYGLYSFVGSAWADQHPFAHVTYAGTYRTAWGLCVAWVVFDCMSHPKGLVNSILSWTPLVYLDRLTFLVYLLHPLVMYYHQARIREVINSDYFDMMYYIIGNIVLSYLVSFLFHVAVEQPVNTLDTLIFGKPRRGKHDVESKGDAVN